MSQITSKKDTSKLVINIEKPVLEEIIKNNAEDLSDDDKKIIQNKINAPNTDKPTDATQQLKLGLKYLKGTIDTQQNYKLAQYWFNKSAQQGNAKAQFNLATMYFKGLGVDIDNKSALKWYKKSANQGEPNAQFNLGFMFLNGLSTEKNIDESIELFKKSAQSGVAKAQLTLGIIYLEGNLLEQDLGQAARWIQKSRVQGEAQAESIWNKYELWKYWQIDS